MLARPIVEKESRKKARERARVRASQKRRLLSDDVQQRDEIFDESLSFEMPWNYASTTHEDGISHPVSFLSIIN